VRIQTKLAAVTTAIAVMAPAGVAQATHEDGKAGAPGQVCAHHKQAKKNELKELRSQSPRPKAAIKAAIKAHHTAYKQCIKEAAEARTDH
jgi:hypothetical protein